MNFSKEQLAYQAVWRKALATGRVDLNFKTVADARRVRFGLYNAIRPIREGKVNDPEMVQAGQDCSVQITGTVLSVVSKFSSETMQEILQAIGLTEGELKGVEEPPATGVVAHEPALPLEVQESMAKVLEKLQQPAPERGRIDYASLLKDLRGEG